MELKKQGTSKVWCPEYGEVLRNICFKQLEVEFYSDERNFEKKYTEEISESEVDLVKELDFPDNAVLTEDGNYQKRQEGKGEFFSSAE